MTRSFGHINRAIYVPMQGPSEVGASGLLEKWDRDEAWEKRLTTSVPCGEYFGVRDQALLAHATQIDPDGQWFSIPRELQVQAWPTEDFELVTSHVETTIPEDDLFAGIRGR